MPALLTPHPGINISPLALLAVLAVGLAACTTGSTGSTTVGATSSLVAAPSGWPLAGQVMSSGPVPVIASSELIVGANRFLFTVVDQQSNPIASPDLTTKVAFYDLAKDPAAPVSSTAGRFLWAIPNERGFYVTDATFSEAGEWGAEITSTPKSGSPSTARIRFQVEQKGSTPAIGSPAPSSPTPTLADVGGDIHRISSDPNPDPTFYQTSEPDALAAHKPFVLVFATPAFCQSRVCGPTLDGVKNVAKQEPGVTFINVEPYELDFVNGQLQPKLDAKGQLQPVKSVDDWGLQTEPWIFVVDGNGIVRGSFEAVVGQDELKAAIDAVK
jgi:hypothetical protein